MAKTGCFLGTDNLQTIDHNNDVSVDDLKTLGFSTDTQMTDLNDIDKIDLKPYGRLNNKSKDDAVFIKQTPVHPRDRLKKLAAEGEEVKFIKQVLVHPTDRLKRKRKGELVKYNRLNKKVRVMLFL